MTQGRRGASDRPTVGRRQRSDNGRRAAPHGVSRKCLIGIVTAAMLLLVVILTLFLSFRRDRLAGTWRYDEVTAYEFDGRGSGKLLLPDNEYAFTYTLTKSELSIDFESEAAKDSVYEYSVSGGELTLSCGEGEQRITYQLKK